MKETWRWYGPVDPISLGDIKQAGATGIVSALHHIPNGQIWPKEEILERKRIIEEYGLFWSVVESVPVHEDIKTRSGNYQTYIDNYKTTVQNLGACGVHILCYNFMPVLDWTRTDLDYVTADGSTAMRFDALAFAAFDLYILEREGAKSEYDTKTQVDAQAYLDQLSQPQIDLLTENVLCGLPGAEEGYTLDQVREKLAAYDNIEADQLTQHLHLFLNELMPVAEKSGVRMCIHPDDPPFPLLGLPRVLSTSAHVTELYDKVPSPNNGLTFCTGSFGVRADNDLTQMVKDHGHRIHFVHLRSTLRDPQGNFFESDHLTGDVDMYSVMRALLHEQYKRQQSGREDHQIPMRPDHGHRMLDDLRKDKVNPGYSAIGRLRGLAELRGLSLGIEKSINFENEV